MTSQLTTTINLIQAINQQVTGVRYAPALSAYPLAADNLLPLVLTAPAEGSGGRQLGGGKRRVIRTMRIIAFVEPIGRGMLPQRLEAAADLLEAMTRAWLDPANTPLQNVVNEGDSQVTVLTDTGDLEDTGIMADLQLGGVSYHGFEIKIKVATIW